MPRLFVRDAVTADVILPRFLAPSDTGRVALSLHNVDGQAGDYKVTLEATGAVSLERPVTETKRLAANQRELMTWPLKAGEVGFGKVAVAVSGPGNFAVRREWDIQVRAAQTPSAVDAVSQLEPSRELTVDREIISPFAAGTAQVSVALSRIPGIDVPALLRALDKYPYGCIEQTTSRALPLLYYNDVALLGYGPADPKIADRVQDAIYRIVDMQIGDGSFGMWGPFSSPAAEWLQSYALDFLLRARDQKMAVPAASLQRGLTWLNRSADRMSPNAQAYAWYVLAKAGLADAGRVRYFQDAKGGEIVGGLAWTQLAAALNQVGEPGRARLAFGIARQRIDQRDSERLLRLRPARPRRPAGARPGGGRPRGLARGGERRARAHGGQGRIHDHAGAGLAGAGGAGDGRRRRARLRRRRRGAQSGQRAGRAQSRCGGTGARHADPQPGRTAGLAAGHRARRAEGAAARGRSRPQRRAQLLFARRQDGRPLQGPPERPAGGLDQRLQCRRRLSPGGIARSPAGRLRDRDRC